MRSPTYPLTATERMPCRRLWNLTIHPPGGLPMGSAGDLDTAKADFKVAWEVFEGQDLAGAVGGGLRGDEYLGRQLNTPPARAIGGHPLRCSLP